MNDLTSINSLHPELLVQIFSLIVYENISVPTDDVFGTYTTDCYFLGLHTKRISLIRAVVLASVCGHWRSVALRATSFWTYTPIILSNRHLQRSLESVPIWLGRARTAPLDIYITTQRYRDAPISKTMPDQVIPRLPFGGKKIHTLYLSLPSTAYLNTLLKSWFSNGVSNTLTQLEIDVENANDELSVLQDWLSQCQELQVLQLYVDTLCSGCFPPMPKLVELKLSSLKVSITTTRLASILHACPSLRRLKLEVLDVRDTTRVELTPEPFEHLEMLHLEILDFALTLPILSSQSNSLSLSINPKFGLVDGDLVDHIIRFSHRSTITALTLHAEKTESSEFCRLISSLPHLQKLSLDELYLDDLAASALRGADEPNTGEGVGPYTCPNLHTLWLTDSTFDNEYTLRSLVSLRRLKQLKLDNCFLEPCEPILQEKELCEYLLGAVSDLSIMNYDNDVKSAYFP